MNNITFWVISALNSQFMSSALGAIAGALVGALTAHRIAAKNRQRGYLITQLRRTNTATMASSIICNDYLILKQQQIIKMKDEYTKHREEYDEFTKDRSKSFKLKADFISISIPKSPIANLTKEVYERIDITGLPIAATSYIEKSMGFLHEAIKEREKVIHKMQSPEFYGKPEMESLYFGYPLSSGQHDTRMLDAMIAIPLYIEDIIFYSHLLTLKLSSKSQRLSETLRKKHSIIIQPNTFKFPEDRDLIPDKDNYSNWLAGFATAETRKKKKRFTNPFRKTDKT